MSFQANLSLVRLLKAQSISTTVTGAAVDLQSYTNPGSRNIKVTNDVGSNLGTTPSTTVKIQDSDTTTTSDFVDLYTGFSAVTATTGELQSAHIKTNKRYLRAVGTVTADTTGVVLSTYVLVGNRLT